MVVSFYIDAGEGVRTIEDVGMWEQLELAAFLQQHWADNQVSSTVTFTEAEAPQIANALTYYQYRLKGISFLPKCQPGTYPQMPYEKITEQVYRQHETEDPVATMSNATLEPQDQAIEKFCDGDTCTLVDVPIDPPKLIRQHATLDLTANYYDAAP